jgi:hypothetical protein
VNSLREKRGDVTILPGPAEAPQPRHCARPSNARLTHLDHPLLDRLDDR